MFLSFVIWHPGGCQNSFMWGKKNSYVSLCHENVYVCMWSCFRRVQLCTTVACQTTLSVGFSRQEYWSGLPCPRPGDLSNPGMGHACITSPALAGGFFTTRTTWKPYVCVYIRPKLDSTRPQMDSHLYEDGQ